MKIVVICSGGLDSTVLYYDLCSQGHSVVPINFSYGSRHNAIERERARELIPGLKEIDIDLSFLKSSLLRNSEDQIPHGRYDESSMKSTVVPFRNGIMLSYAIAFAESENMDAVALGSHSGDHSIYPDCRPEFTSVISTAAITGTYNRICVLSPYNTIDKGGIVSRGHELGIDSIMARTWTCYSGGEIHCGKCGSCSERKEAFITAGVTDYTLYKE